MRDNIVEHALGGNQTNHNTLAYYRQVMDFLLS